MENMVKSRPAEIDRLFWNGKKVLITGHTGFKGGWLTIWLNRLGCEVVGMSLEPKTDPALFDIANVKELCDSHIFNIHDRSEVQALLEQSRPEIVFHLAAQSLVYDGYQNPHETFSTNVMGTVNLLESIRLTGSCKTIVMVTSDKVYQSGIPEQPHKEDDILGGRDPYSASKAASELVIECYRHAFLEQLKVAIASARAGNVIGGGDWATARLIPDAIRAWSGNKTLQVRQPKSIRPWQHVLEPLYGYLLLAQKLARDPEIAGAFNFGPVIDNSYSVERIIELAQTQWPGGAVILGNIASQFLEASWLMVDSSKARKVLGFRPAWGVEETVKRTIRWYRDYADNKNPLELCLNDIEKYEQSHR